MALLGTLQVRLGLDAAAFSDRFRSFSKDLEKRTNGFQRSLRGLTSLGSVLGGVGITAGLRSVISTASQFEGQMQGVKAVMSSLSENEFTQLAEKARELGASTRYTASESASAIEMLAKNGLSATTILGGALDASLALAAATGAELPQAADIATDAMLVFGKQAAELAKVVDDISGVTKNSKFDINAYQAALAAGGAGAVKAGQSFEDFNATLVATSSFFASGETAGTAFKVFTDKLVNDSAKAEKAQEMLGIRFFDTAGKIRDFADIAEDLRTGLAGLSDQDAISSLTNIFGTRGANFAVAMAKSGREGIVNARLAIAQADAAAQAAERLKGLQGTMIVFRSAMEGLMLTIAEGGLLDFLTGLAKRATDLVGVLSKAPPALRNFGIGVAFAGAALPIVAFGLSSVAGVIPIVAKGLGGVATFFLGPWGIALAAAGAAVALFIGDIGGIGPALDTFKGKNKVYVDDFKSAWGDLRSSLSTSLSTIEMVISGSSSSLRDASVEHRLFANSWEEFFTGIVINATLAVETIKSAWDGLMAVSAQFGEFLYDQWADLKSRWDNDMRQWQILWRELSSAVTEFIDLIKQIPAAFNSMWAAAETANRKLEQGFDRMVAKGKGALGGLGKSIADTTKGLIGFGDAGEKEADRAVGNSWLTDLCEKGITLFRRLVGEGIEPARAAIGQLGREGAGVRGFGQGFADAFTPRAIPVDESTGRDLYTAADDFESAWSLSLANTQQAMDGFVREGSLSFKGLLNSFLADLASAQLSKGVKALWDGILGMGGASSGGGSASTWGSVLGGVFKAFGSFDGGGYTGSGPRTGGLDGKGGRLAMLHPRETVIDHSKVRASGESRGSGLNLTVPITLMPGVSHEELSKILPAVQKQIIETIPKLIARGGGYAAAYGR